MEYHQSTKLDDTSELAAPEVSGRPVDLWNYPGKTVVKLDKELLNIPASVVPLLQKGLHAVPAELHSPHQNLRTLSTWLFMACGMRRSIKKPWGDAYARAIGSIDHSYCDEIYVAAFSIDGLEPGFYRYSYKSHSLTKLREAGEALALLRRGRPDLQFLSEVPCAVLVSSVFCRSSWIYGKRGYRKSILEAGQLTANLHATAMGLGMISYVRLRMNDLSMRELIGLRREFTYPEAESVQSMIVWSDEIQKPQPKWDKPTETLPQIERINSDKVLSYGSILAAHNEAMSVSVAVREVRPPLTDFTPVPPHAKQHAIDIQKQELKCLTLKQVLTDPMDCETFTSKPIPQIAIHRITQCAFRGGTFFPLKPDGPHTALVRPFWVLHNVTGLRPGIWWYDPVINRWVYLNEGEYHEEVGHLMRRPEELKYASAICVIVANLKMLMEQAGPDLYRLAHLEAGLAAQRLVLAARSLELASNVYPDFADDLWRHFLGLGNTGWEVLATLAFGGGK